MKDELVDIVMNIHQFNQDLTTLNIKQAETIEEQKQEIERLNYKLQQKESIIKEVREYIESYNLPEDLGYLGEAPISIRELRDILEILDKGE